MSETFLNKFVEKWFKERFFFVLVSLLSFLILSPLLKGFIGLSSFLDIFLSVVLISSIYAVSQKKHHLIIAALLVFPLPCLFLALFQGYSFLVSWWLPFCHLY